MVLEVALIDITPGQEEAFVAAVETVKHLVTTTPGCHNLRLTGGIESPSRFVLLVEWDSVRAHQENFRDTDRWVQWRAAIGPHFAGPPVVEHFVDVLAAA